MASPRTIARPHCRAELCGNAEQSQASVQEELGLTEDWSRTSWRSGAWPQCGPYQAPEHSREPERNLSDERAWDPVRTGDRPQWGPELVLSGEQSRASEKQSHVSRRNRAELQ